MSLRPVEFAARDGFRLGGILYRPAQPNGRAVLLNGAVGVRQQYYAAFAAFLEERGFTVLTYDYRGIAASRHGPLRALHARIRDWAKRAQIDPARVRSGSITLNHDGGRWLSLGLPGDLPAVVREVNGQWQRQP